jgi:hypothetical protein
MVELLVAALVLIVGMGAFVTTFTAARKLTLVSERQTAMVHRANSELERVKSLSYNQIALTGTSSSWSTNSASYTYVNVPSGNCPTASAGAAPTYQPDHSGASSTTEPLVINGCSYSLAAGTTQVSGGTIAPVTAWTDGRFSGFVYDFITWTNDPTCSQTSTPGSACPTTNDYKRITIVVTITGATEPSHPAIVTAFLPNPNQYGGPNPTQTSNCTNTSGQSISCPGTSQSPVQYFFCDSSYSNGSCSAPACSGNNLHNTLLSVLGVAPSPDLLGSTLPSGSCTDQGGNPAPPCYGLNILNNCLGLPITPVSGSSCGSGPPSSNSQAHSWVTPGIPSGTTLNLTGTGGLTTYLQSSSGVAVNVTVCMGLYVVPGGILGSVLGNLLSHPIGAVVSANVTASASFPTPVSFNFNVGSADAIAGGGLLGLPRVEIVLWLAANAGTSVQFVYDQVSAASQVTLMTS